jgi:hypothetical protein
MTMPIPPNAVPLSDATAILLLDGQWYDMGNGTVLSAVIEPCFIDPQSGQLIAPGEPWCQWVDSGGTAYAAPMRSIAAVRLLGPVSLWLPGLFTHRGHTVWPKPLTIYLLCSWYVVKLPAMDAVEIAWAAGFFDGEGHVRAARQLDRNGTEVRWLNMQIGQSDRRPLERFQKIFGGRIIAVGPNKLSSKPRWQWYLSRRAEVRAAMEAMLPYLSQPKTEQWEAALEACPIKRRSRFDLPARSA